MRLRTLLSIALLCLTPTLVRAVAIYDMHEISKTNTNSYSNKFDFAVITLSATFTSPTAQTLSVTGFYDGDGAGAQTGNIWKIRASFNETGTWTYTCTWSDATACTGGSVAVTSGTNKGPLKRDPSFPFHFVHANGEHFFWAGDTEWFFLSDDFTQANRLTAIDFLESKKVNNFLMVMVNDDTNQVFPWVSTSNHTTFDLQRMRRWEEVVATMQSKGIVADLWFYSDGSTGIMPTENSANEDLYFRYIIARFSAYSNVAWNLALEQNEYRSDEWVETRAAYIKTHDPYDHLVSVHRTTEDFPFFGDPSLDHTSLQNLGTTPSALHSIILTRRSDANTAGRAIPIVHEEFHIEGTDGDLDQYRGGIWEIITAGGYWKGASLGWWIGTVYTSGVHWDVAMYAYNFMSTRAYWRLTPSDSLITSGTAHMTAETDKAYIGYLPSGGTVNVNLAAASGTFNVSWYNPRTGATTSGGTTTGGATRTLSAPNSSQDWVLAIEEPGDSLAPAAPTNLRIEDPS